MTDTMRGAPPAGGAANVGFIGAIVAVATIGGLLFGYDSGAAESSFLILWVVVHGRS